VPFFFFCVIRPAENHGHVAAPELSPVRSGVHNHRTCGGTGALTCKEVGSGATGRVAAPEPSYVGRWGTELWDAWQRRSPPMYGDEVQSCGTYSSARALPCREVGLRAAEHVATPDRSPAWWRGPKQRDT
jgi:hypothetical protein